MTPEQLGTELAEGRAGRGIYVHRDLRERAMAAELWGRIEALRQVDPAAAVETGSASANW
jgi:hypothetical protein